MKQVRRTRAQWTPTKNSVLCSEHFSEDSFEVDSAIAATFGISKRRLKPDAVPTIFQRQSSVGSGSEDQRVPRKRSADPLIATSSKRARGAVEKRERIRVSST